MPFYLSIAGLLLRHGSEFLAAGQTADEDGSGDFDNVAALRAISDAEAMVNSALGARNDLPLPDVTDRDDPEANPAVPDVLRGIVADIAVYRMAAEHDGLTVEKRKRYEDAMSWLGRYSDGKASLGVEVEPGASGGVYMTSAPRLFGRDRTRGLM